MMGMAGANLGYQGSADVGSGGRPMSRGNNTTNAAKLHMLGQPSNLPSNIPGVIGPGGGAAQQ